MICAGQSARSKPPAQPHKTALLKYQKEPDTMITLNFLLTSLIVVLIPGTGVVYTISTGLTLGKRASIIAALGCTAGIVPHLAATILGLSALMHTSALAFQVLKYAGVADRNCCRLGTSARRDS